MWRQHHTIIEQNLLCHVTSPSIYHNQFYLFDDDNNNNDDYGTSVNRSKRRYAAVVIDPLTSHYSCSSTRTIQWLRHDKAKAVVPLFSLFDDDENYNDYEKQNQSWSDEENENNNEMEPWCILYGNFPFALMMSRMMMMIIDSLSISPSILVRWWHDVHRYLFDQCLFD